MKHVFVAVVAVGGGRGGTESQNSYYCWCYCRVLHTLSSEQNPEKRERLLELGARTVRRKNGTALFCPPVTKSHRPTSTRVLAAQAADGEFSRRWPTVMSLAGVGE